MREDIPVMALPLMRLMISETIPTSSLKRVLTEVIIQMNKYTVRR